MVNGILSAGQAAPSHWSSLQITPLSELRRPALPPLRSSTIRFITCFNNAFLAPLTPAEVWFVHARRSARLADLGFILSVRATCTTSLKNVWSLVHHCTKLEDMPASLASSCFIRWSQASSKTSELGVERKKMIPVFISLCTPQA
eukprot:scaffold295096_cov32-Tisochrysis_lutea.AAC.3